MNTKHTLFAIVGAFALVMGAFFATRSFVASPALKHYSNDTVGISFQYPETYEVREWLVPEYGTTTTHIALMKKGTTIPANSDGQPNISFVMYPTALEEDMSIKEWVQSHATSTNFSVSPDKIFSDVTVDGNPAVAYGWDGSYRGMSLAVDHSPQVILASVMYADEKDSFYKDFPGIIASTKLTSVQQ